MPSRLPYRYALLFAALLIAMPSQSTAQRYGPRGNGGGWHGGGWHGGGYGYRGGYGGYPAYGGYRAYGAYPYYPRYRAYYGYPGYYGHYHDGAWIAAAGILGVVLGSVVAQPYVYPYPPPVVYAPPPPPAPAPVTTQQCPDGSTIPVGSYCPAAPPPVAAPAPRPERG